MITKKRPPRAGNRVKAGRRLIAMPGVTSMTDPNSSEPTTRPAEGESERPTDELTEELTRTVKAAYQQSASRGLERDARWRPSTLTEMLIA
jgi:hypothetical protein